MSNFVYATLSKNRDYIDALSQIQYRDHETPEHARYVQIFNELNLCMQILMDLNIINTGQTMAALHEVILKVHDLLDNQFADLNMEDTSDERSRHIIKCTLMLRKLEELYIESMVAQQANDEGRTVTQAELDYATGRTNRQIEEAIPVNGIEVAGA